MRLQSKALPILLTVLGIVAIFAVGVLADSSEKTDFPDAVLKAFAKSFPGIKATVYEMESKDGQVQYEIEAEVDGVKHDYTYLEDGTLIETSEEIDFKNLPKVVMESIKKAYPKGEFDDAEKTTRGSTIEYEVKVENGENEFDIIVSADGHITVSDQADDDDDMENGEDDD